jgi:hypothetical protein
MSTELCPRGVRIAYTDIFTCIIIKYAGVGVLWLMSFSQIEKHIMCLGWKYIEFLTSNFALRHFIIKEINVRN